MMPQILREIVTASLSKQEDIQVVTHVKDSDELLAAVQRQSADLVLLSCPEQQLDAIGGRLVLANPSLKLLALSDSAQRGHLYELLPHRTPLGELSPREIAEVIRRACRRPNGSTPASSSIPADERPED